MNNLEQHSKEEGQAIAQELVEDLLWFTYEDQDLVFEPTPEEIAERYYE